MNRQEVLQPGRSLLGLSILAWVLTLVSCSSTREISADAAPDKRNGDADVVADGLAASEKPGGGNANDPCYAHEYECAPGTSEEKVREAAMALEKYVVTVADRNPQNRSYHMAIDKHDGGGGYSIGIVTYVPLSAEDIKQLDAIASPFGLTRTKVNAPSCTK